MKKIKVVSLMFVFLTFISFLLPYNTLEAKASSVGTINYYQKEENVPTYEEYEDNIRETIPINSKELVSKTLAGQTFAVFLGYKECPACRAFSPTIKSFLNHNYIKLYYYDVNTISKDDLTPDLKNIIQNTIKLKGTPTIALIKHKKLIHEYVGSDVTEKQLLTLTKYKLS